MAEIKRSISLIGAISIGIGGMVGGGTVTFIDNAFKHNLFSGGINVLSASFVSRSETYIVILKILILIFIIVSSINSVDVTRLSPQKWADPMSIL